MHRKISQEAICLIRTDLCPLTLDTLTMEPLVLIRWGTQSWVRWYTDLGCETRGTYGLTFLEIRLTAKCLCGEHVLHLCWLRWQSCIQTSAMRVSQMFGWVFGLLWVYAQHAWCHLLGNLWGSPADYWHLYWNTAWMFTSVCSTTNKTNETPCALRDYRNEIPDTRPRILLVVHQY